MTPGAHQRGDGSIDPFAPPGWPSGYDWQPEPGHVLRRPPLMDLRLITFIEQQMTWDQIAEVHRRPDADCLGYPRAIVLPDGRSFKVGDLVGYGPTPLSGVPGDA